MQSAGGGGSEPSKSKPKPRKSDGSSLNLGGNLVNSSWDAQNALDLRNYNLAASSASAAKRAAAAKKAGTNANNAMNVFGVFGNGVINNTVAHLTHPALSIGKGPDIVPPGYGQKKAPVDPTRNISPTPDWMRNPTAATTASDPVHVPTPTEQMLSQLQSDLAKGGPTQSWSGKMSDYLASVGKAIKGVDYTPAMNNAKSQEAQSDKAVAGSYGALKDYIAGMGKEITAQYADSGKNLQQNATNATDLLNSSYNSGRDNIAKNMALMGDKGGWVLGNSQGHQQQVADSLAARAQGDTDYNTNMRQEALGNNTASGIVGQAAGNEARTQLKRELANVLIGYQTKQAEADAQRSMNVYQLAQNSFSSDRGYAEQQYQDAVNAHNTGVSNDFNMLNYLTGRDDFKANQDAAGAKFLYQQGQDAVSNSIKSDAPLASLIGSAARNGSMQPDDIRKLIDTFNKDRIGVPSKQGG